jgi:hypothetical protein
MTVGGLRFGLLKKLSVAGGALMEPGRKALRKGLSSNKDKNGIFISHITAESAVARLLQTRFRDTFGEATLVFVSSDYGSMAGGEEWFPTIVNAIQRSMVVVVLLSKGSVGRRWINFEAGVGLGANRRVIPVVIDDLAKGEVGLPLSQLQVRSLNDSEDMHGLFNDLADAIGAGDGWTVDIARLAKEIERLPTKEINFY